MVKLICFFVFLLACEVRGKVFTRCELARELIRQGFPMADLRNWICLVEAESERNTKYKGGPKKNSSYDLGLFQLNEYIYCGKKRPGGECKMKCSDFLKDDISKAARCAFLIHQYNGFKVWPEWNDRCQDTLPKIDNCCLKHVQPLKTQEKVLSYYVDKDGNEHI